jgi:hypothetical protein
MYLHPLIKQHTIDYIDLLVYDYQYKSIAEMPARFRDNLYEMVIENLYSDPIFLELILMDDFLFGILNGVYVKTVRDELIERLSDICDPIFDILIQEKYNELYETDGDLYKALIEDDAIEAGKNNIQ